MRYTDMENQMLGIQRQISNPDALHCEKCNSTYFEVIAFTQYRGNYTTFIGQEPPKIFDAQTFYILRCVCGHLVAPLVHRSSAPTAMTKQYDLFLDSVEAAQKKEK